MPSQTLANQQRHKVGVLVVAYNAANTLMAVLDRIPMDVRKKVDHIFVCDDFSQDETYQVSLRYQKVSPDMPITVIRHSENLGYGGNQKAGYRLAIEYGLDIVVLLHGDGQYAPEHMPSLLEPLERGLCDAVFGSRMLTKGGALQGGMPIYKFVGNRILTKFENKMLRMNLSEFHSGYRAYRVKALKDIDFDSNSNGFNFDTQIIIQLHHAHKRIVEVPIPTYYGDEISYVNGLKYAKDITFDVLRYRLEKRGFLSGHLAGVGDDYAIKDNELSSHGHILRIIRSLPPSRVLDLGCSSGRLSEKIRDLGHSVTGVDVSEMPGVRQRLDQFYEADLDLGVPPNVGANFDVVVAADVLEHLREPEKLLAQIRSLLVPGGIAVISIPNFGHWYSRGRTALGLFDYDQRGILDKSHVRFFTKNSFRRMVKLAGFSIRESENIGLPLDVLAQNRSKATVVAQSVSRGLVATRPTLFAYQFLFVLTTPTPSIINPPLSGAENKDAHQGIQPSHRV